MSLDALLSNENLAVASAGFVLAAVVQAIYAALQQQKRARSAQHLLLDIKSQIARIRTSADQYSVQADELITELVTKLELADAEIRTLRTELERLQKELPSHERPANG